MRVGGESTTQAIAVKVQEQHLTLANPPARQLRQGLYTRAGLPTDLLYCLNGFRNNQPVGSVREALPPLYCRARPLGVTQNLKLAWIPPERGAP